MDFLNGWSLAILLFVALVGLFIFYQRLKQDLRQQIAANFGLRREIAQKNQDITELRTRRKRLLAASTQALIIVEKDYRVSSANKVAKKLFGRLNKEGSFIQWTRQHELQELVSQVLQGNKMPSTYVNAKERILVARARSIKDKTTKEIVAVALAIHDVTEITRLSRARRDFVTNISHELRTPITSIGVLTETLLNGTLADAAKAHELVTKIALQTEALSQVAQEVLDLSLIESGRAPLRLANYSLREIVQSEVDKLHLQAKHKKLQLKIDISPDMKVLVDKGMVNRVITNLLHNAIKFTSRGTITITTQPFDSQTMPHAEDHEDETWVVVTVADTGIGINPADIDRLFERFYIVDRSRSSKEAGTGLGLAIAKHIVEAHGGRIWAESDGQNGSTFYFTLPVEE